MQLKHVTFCLLMTVPESNSPASSYAYFSRICEGLSKTVSSIIKYYRTPSSKALLKMIWFPLFPLSPLVKATKTHVWATRSASQWFSLNPFSPTSNELMFLQQTEWSLKRANRILLLSYLKTANGFHCP